MKIVVNKKFPFEGYAAITIFYWIFVRQECASQMTEETVNHENIHFWQLIGLFLAGATFVTLLHVLFGTSLWWLLLAPFTFYVMYGGWWLFTLKFSYIKAYAKWYFGGRIGKAPENTAYYDLPFEREAYGNQRNTDYCKGWKKPLFTWLKYIRKSK